MNLIDEAQSISRWIEDMKNDVPQAADKLWKQYFDKLVRLARQRLGNLPRRIADEEDLALSALKSVLMDVRDDRYPDITDRSDLWKLLVVVTSRKVIARYRQHFASKRPDRHLLEPEQDADGELSPISQVTGREPSPEFAASFAEEVHNLLSLLPDDDFRRLAIFKMEGYTNLEIATKLDWYTVKVERRLRIIRKLWSKPYDSS